MSLTTQLSGIPFSPVNAKVELVQKKFRQPQKY